MRPTDIKNSHAYDIYCEGDYIGNASQLNFAKLFAKSFAENQEKDVIILNSYTGEILCKIMVKYRIEIVEIEP